jgi:tripartite-type tricarboxylate transporter receptor subunit TctC
MHPLRVRLAFASSRNGISGHLALELFRMAARSDVTHLPYAGGGPAPVANSSQGFVAFMRSERDKWSCVIKAANIRVE